MYWVEIGWKGVSDEAAASEEDIIVKRDQDGEGDRRLGRYREGGRGRCEECCWMNAQRLYVPRLVGV